MDLVPLELGMLAGGREHHHAALRVDLPGHLEASREGVCEEFSEHRDDVLVGVVVVVPEHHVVAGLALGLWGRLRSGGRSSLLGDGLSNGTGGGGHLSGTLATHEAGSGRQEENIL